MLNARPREKCGVFGVRMKTQEAAGVTYNALLALQHRGQEGAGIAVLKDSSIPVCKDTGLASEVFTPEALSRLPKSHFAIGHVRYSTTGGNVRENVQPIVTDYLLGRIATAHNGNIVNAPELKEKLKGFGFDFVSTNDTEIISSLVAYEALRGLGIEKAVVSAAKKLRGAFSLVILSSKNKLIALRDGCGFRPLCIGKSDEGYAVASESCALECAGFDFLRDVRPGEMVVIDDEGNIETSVVLEQENTGSCIFEYVYFARPDSVIDGLSVYEAHFQSGVALARESPADADVVCGVPDGGIEPALGFAQASGIPYALGFVKNRYVGRTFIYPSQIQRESAVRVKLNPLRVNVEGKRVVLVDDSIVRGTTSAKIVRSLKAAGAKEIHMRISSPPFRHSCHFGIDIDSEDNLIANRLSVDEIAKQLGVDSLRFLSVEGLVRVCGKSHNKLCTGCFTGSYPIELGHHTKSQFE